ncbi:MAG TPA: type II toxin-antitoxin system RelE/ParE family toxin [Nitrospirota bacterium]|nr:type II toxin-antitoxin system RelE/ParE family toxin [Nitrospirota bacterium]
MTYTLRFLPEVEEDIIGGYVWYEAKSPGLGEDFLRMFYAGASEIQWNPFLYPKVYNEFRRRLLRRFPYAIYFMIEDEYIIVFGFFHCARNPSTIKKKLHDREKPENP